MNDRSQNDRTAAQKEMEALQREYERLRQQKIRAEADRENAERRLEELETEARESFGTADPDELRAMLEDLEATNQKLARDYGVHLSEIDAALKKVEAAVASDDRKSDGNA